MSTMTSLLPSEYEQPLTAYIRNAHDLYLNERPGADWDAFLSANGHLPNAFLLSSRAAGLRALVGSGTHYRDPAETRDRLQQLTEDALRAAAQQEQAEENPSMRRTASGIIVPGAEPASVPGKRGLDSAPRILIPGRDD